MDVGEPLIEWILAKVARVEILVRLLIIVSALSFADVAWEWKTGVATVSWPGKATSNCLENPEPFARIIRFELVRSCALILLTLCLQQAVASVRKFDIFAPGQKFKDLGDD